MQFESATSPVVVKTREKVIVAGKEIGEIWQNFDGRYQCHLNKGPFFSASTSYVGYCGSDGESKFSVIDKAVRDAVENGKELLKMANWYIKNVELPDLHQEKLEEDARDMQAEMDKNANHDGSR